MTKAGIYTSSEEKQMILQGFRKLQPSQLVGLEEEDILRMPNGDIYEKPKGMSELELYEAKKQIDAKYKTTGGGGGVSGFKFSSDDRGRLLAVNFNSEDINRKIREVVKNNL